MVIETQTHMKNPFKKQPKIFSLPSIHKCYGYYLPNAVESTPVVYQDQLYLINFERPVVGQIGTAWVLYDFFSKKEIYRHPWPHMLGCAFIENNTLYIYGTTGWVEGFTHIDMMQAELDPTNPAQPIKNTSPIIKIWDSIKDQRLFNTSVCKGSSLHQYVMAYETEEKGLVNFSVRFAISKDLKKWESIGTIFHPDIYAACPTIRYLNGYYYILYLRSVGKYYMEYISRTKDFRTFEDFQGNNRLGSNVQVLSSMRYDHEGINNSDIDLVEFRGITYIIYADGDQQTWANLRTAIYLGTMDQFFAEFWPKS